MNVFLLRRALGWIGTNERKTDLEERSGLGQNGTIHLGLDTEDLEPDPTTEESVSD